MNHLVSSLLKRKALNPDTVLTANYREGNHKRQDQFRMVAVEQIGSDYRFRLKRLVGEDEITVWAAEVVALDGMDPIRYVDVYDINPDGTSKKTGKKRGRKPKYSL